MVLIGRSYPPSLLSYCRLDIDEYGLLFLKEAEYPLVDWPELAIKLGQITLSECHIVTVTLWWGRLLITVI